MLRPAPAISFLLTMGLVSACSPRMPAATSQSAVANPASVYCLQQGGTLDLRTVSGSVVGVCTFSDGSECEEWQYFRRECLPAGSPATRVEVQSPALTLDSLKNARYHSPNWGDFQLVSGVFHRPPSAPGESPEANLTQLIEPVAYGDLNADGLEDAVVFLIT